MENRDDKRLGWRFFDGSVAISVSMLLAVLSRVCLACDGLPVLGQLHRLTRWEDGVIIVATLLLFPTAGILFGGVAVFFAAREAVHSYFRERGRREGLKEGRQEGLKTGRQEGLKAGRKAERERIERALAERGVPLTQEQVEILAGEPEQSQQ